MAKPTYHKELARHILKAKRLLIEASHITSANKHEEFGMPYGWLRSRLELAEKESEEAKRMVD